MPIDFNTDLGKVRTLTGDTVEGKFFMSDDELNTIIGLEGGVIYLSAATALETMATKHAMIAQKIKTMDLATDGPAVAKALLDRAKALREQYEKILETEAGSDFEIFPMIFNNSQRLDYWLKRQFQYELSE